MKNDTVVWLEDVGKEDIAIVGSKGASLVEMIHAELPVPSGFAVTTQAFRRVIDENGVGEELFKSPEVDVDNTEALKKAEKKAKKIIMDAKIPADIEENIRLKYRELCKREGDEVFVDVRPSVTAEGLYDTNFKGQQDTSLTIKEEQNVLKAIKKCWASLCAYAIHYRMKHGLDYLKVNLCVVVQLMVDPDKGGVMYTSDPHTGNPLTIIKGGWGLAETVVSDAVSHDLYVVDKRTKKIIRERKNANKNVMRTKDSKTGKTIETRVFPKLKNVWVLEDEEIFTLVGHGEVVEKLYNTPQEVEWAIKDKDQFILESRPITTIKKPKKIKVAPPAIEGLKEEIKKLISDIIELSRHFINLLAALLFLWIVDKLTDLIFPNKPLIVKILIYTSEVVIIFLIINSFAKEIYKVIKVQKS